MLIHKRGRDKLCWVRDGFSLRKDLQGLRDRKTTVAGPASVAMLLFHLWLGKTHPECHLQQNFSPWGCLVLRLGGRKAWTNTSRLPLGWQPGRGVVGRGINCDGVCQNRCPASSCPHCATAWGACSNLCSYCMYIARKDCLVASS